MTQLRTTVGVVLAGGASRRMGSDKALLKVGADTFVEHAAKRLAEVTAEVVLADRGRQSVAGYPSCPDGPGAGPAAGILGAARHHPGKDLLVLACDLPAIPVALLRCLAMETRGAAHVPRWGGETRDEAVGSRAPNIEPLCALYRPAAIAALEEVVAAGSYGLVKFLRSERVEVRFLEGSELTGHGPPRRLFANINSPQDLARFTVLTSPGKAP